MLARLYLSTSAAVILTFTAAAQVAASGTAPDRATETRPLQRGEALFLGNAPLQGKPRDHVDFLPPQVVRCANCHATRETTGKVTMNGAVLTEFRQRRHGPPSAYDQTKFCKLLRTGVDPAYIMIDHAMPIYDLPDTDCAALWSYVLHTETPHVGK